MDNQSKVVHREEERENFCTQYKRHHNLLCGVYDKFLYVIMRSDHTNMTLVKSILVQEYKIFKNTGTTHYYDDND